MCLTVLLLQLFSRHENELFFIPFVGKELYCDGHISCKCTTVPAFPKEQNSIAKLHFSIRFEPPVSTGCLLIVHSGTSMANQELLVVCCQ